MSSAAAVTGLGCPNDLSGPIVCPACGAANHGGGISVPDREYGLDYVAYYVECQACGTLMQSPMPTLLQLAKFYPAHYHSRMHRGLPTKIRNHIRIRRLAELAQVDGPILDYGCGDGSFLLQAASSMPDRRFWGFEIADRSEVDVLASGAVTILKGSLEDLLARLPACSLITLNHVIEHLPDPYATVRMLAERLLPAGVFEGQTPAADSVERSIFGTRWSGYHAPRHTVVFSRFGLKRMLDRCGLSGVAIKGAFNPAGLAVSIGSIPRKGSGHIQRSGVKWLSFLALAGVLAPIDLLSGRPGIMDFVAYKNPS